jgi:phosphate:Na+ symporter
MGLGLVFFGMQLMSDGTYPLRSYQPFIDMMSRMDNPWMAILMSAAFTALVQSSSATTGLVIVLAGQGFITLEAGIALIFGANVGTCITAILASIGKSREAVRSAMVHLIFNIGGVLIWYPFIDRLAQFTLSVSLDAETPRQIANAHTIFNVSNTLIFIWFTTPLGWLVAKLLPSKAEEGADWSEPRYLNEYVVRTPALALDFARLELNRLGASVRRMVVGVLDTVISGDSRSLNQLARMDDEVDTLHAALVTYLGRLSQENLTDEQSHELQGYLAAANYLENIGDMVETNLVDVGRERARRGLQISSSTCQVLKALDRKVMWSVGRSIEAIASHDPAAAREVMDAKVEMSRLARAAEEHLSKRLAADEPNRLVAFRLESEVMEYLRRMYYFSKRIAKLVTEADGTQVDEAEEAA